MKPKIKDNYHFFWKRNGNQYESRTGFHMNNNFIEVMKIK